MDNTIRTNAPPLDKEDLRVVATKRASAAHRETYLPNSPIKVKKLGHIVYEVSDIERTVRFWTEAMGFKESERNAKGMVFLRYGSDHHALGIKDGKGKSRADAFGALRIEHLAMEVEDIDALIAARDYLTANGLPIVYEGRKGAAGNTSLHFLDPDGYEFELYCNLDQIDESGRVRPKEQFHPTTTLEEAKANPLPKKW
jgi:catechol 2,3-dioxygenase-like lactoylglutathione lyase family enzyme